MALAIDITNGCGLNNMTTYMHLLGIEVFSQSQVTTVAKVFLVFTILSTKSKIEKTTGGHAGLRT